jgi:hypothetical protein
MGEKKVCFCGSIETAETDIIDSFLIKYLSEFVAICETAVVHETKWRLFDENKNRGLKIS